MLGYAPYLGQVRLRIGAIVEQQTTVEATPITQTPIPLALKRFEIKDEEGNFVPNAAVTLTLPDGRHFMTKLSDAGGNVSFPTEEIDIQARAMNLREVKSGQVQYTVSAPGKATVQGVFWDLGVEPEGQVGLQEITLKSQGPGVGFVLPVVLLTVVAGVIVYSAVK